MADSGRKGGRGKAAGGVGGLVGSGPSVVGLSGSMRARDVSRIRADDVARAQRSLVIRRRPPDPPAEREDQPRRS